MWWQRKSPDFEWETVAKRGKARMVWETIHRSVEKPWETKSVEFPLPPTNHQRVLQLCPGDWRIAFWRFCQGGPRGSVDLSIYLSICNSVHPPYTNQWMLYIYIYILQTYWILASIIIPISRWFHSCEACKVPDLRMMSQLSQLESELQEPEISLWCRTAGRSCVFFAENSWFQCFPRKWSINDWLPLVFIG